VRSLSSHFKWVTCPALLRRVAADAKRLGITNAVAYDGPILSDETAIVPRASQTSLFLEEFSFTQKAQNLGALVTWLASFGGDGFAELLDAQLAIVSDDMFAHLCTFATPVTPHIAIDNERKAVKAGALWYQESLPPETVLYLSLAANPSRRQNIQISAADILRSTLDLFPPQRPYLQLGGHETVGMGWCRVQPVYCSAKE